LKSVEQIWNMVNRFEISWTEMKYG